MAGGISLIDQISYKGRKQNFSRDSFDTIAEMVAFREIHLPDIFEAFCYETRKKYRYDINNEIDAELGKWREADVVTDGQANKIESISLNDEKLEIDIDKNVNIDLSNYALKEDIKLKSISLNSEPIEVDDNGNSNIEIDTSEFIKEEDIPIKSISVDESNIEVDENRNVNIDLSGKVDKEDGKSLISAEELEQIGNNKNAIDILNGIGEGSVAKQVADGVSASMKMHKIIVDEIPSVDEAEDNTIYLVKEPDQEWYNMYMKVTDINEIEQVTFTGTTETKYTVDLSKVEYQNEAHVDIRPNAKDTLDGIFELVDGHTESINTLVEHDVTPDWEQTDETQPDYIKNKPTIPEVPIKKISVNGEEVESDENGNVAITTPDAPVQSISVNGEEVAPDENGNVAVTIPDAPVQSVSINDVKFEPDDTGNINIVMDDTLSSTSENAVMNKTLQPLLQGDEDIEGSIENKVYNLSKKALSGITKERITYILNNLPEKFTSHEIGGYESKDCIYTILEISQEEYDDLISDNDSFLEIGSVQSNGTTYEIRIIYDSVTSKFSAKPYKPNTYSTGVVIEVTPKVNIDEFSITEAFDTKADKVDIPDVPIKSISLNDVPLDIDDDGNVDINNDSVFEVETLPVVKQNQIYNVAPTISVKQLGSVTLEEGKYYTNEEFAEAIGHSNFFVEGKEVFTFRTSFQRYQNDTNIGNLCGTANTQWSFYIDEDFNIHAIKNNFRVSNEYIPSTIEETAVFNNDGTYKWRPIAEIYYYIGYEGESEKVYSKDIRLATSLELASSSNSNLEEAKQYTDTSVLTNVTNKLAQPLGFATLDDTGKLLPSQLPISSMEIVAYLDADSNHTLPDVTPYKNGDEIVVTTSGYILQSTAFTLTAGKKLTTMEVQQANLLLTYGYVFTLESEGTSLGTVKKFGSTKVVFSDDSEITLPYATDLTASSTPAMVQTTVKTGDTIMLIDGHWMLLQNNSDVESVNGHRGKVTLTAEDIPYGNIKSVAIKLDRLATVADTGDYDDLTDKPLSVKTDGTIEIGTAYKTFFDNLGTVQSVNEQLPVDGNVTLCADQIQYASDTPTTIADKINDLVGDPDTPGAIQTVAETVVDGAAETEIIDFDDWE